MNLLAVIEVGKQFPFPRGGRGIEGSVFQYDATGYRLTIYVSGLSSREAEAIRSEALYHFFLVTVGSSVFVLTRIVLPPKPAVGRFAERILAETEAPYSWHLVPTPLRPSLEHMDALALSSKERATFQVTVIDSLTNIVQASQFVSSSKEFTAGLHRAVAQQARQPFRVTNYQDEIATIQRQYTIKQLSRMASVRCIGGLEEGADVSEGGGKNTADSGKATASGTVRVPAADRGAGGDGKVKTIERDCPIDEDNDYGLTGVLPHRPVFMPYEQDTHALMSTLTQVKTLEALWTLLHKYALWRPFFEYDQLERSEVADAVVVQVGGNTLKLLVARKQYYSGQTGFHLPEEVERKALIASRLCGLK